MKAKKVNYKTLRYIWDDYNYKFNTSWIPANHYIYKDNTRYKRDKRSSGILQLFSFLMYLNSTGDADVQKIIHIDIPTHDILTHRKPEGSKTITLDTESVNGLLLLIKILKKHEKKLTRHHNND